MTDNSACDDTYAMWPIHYCPVCYNEFTTAHDLIEHIIKCHMPKLPEDSATEPSPKSTPTLKQPPKPQRDHDPVHHPSHYTSHPSGIECIDVIEHFGFCVGSAIKYLWRAGLKYGADELEDLQKAEYYIKREITRRKRQAEQRVEHGAAGSACIPPASTL